MALLFSGSPRFSFQSHQRSVFSLQAAGAAINKSVSGRGQYLVWFPHGDGGEGGDPGLNQQSRGVAHGKLAGSR